MWKLPVALLLLLALPACFPIYDDDPVPDDSFCPLSPGCHYGTCDSVESVPTGYQTCGGGSTGEGLVLACVHGTWKKAGWTCPPSWTPVDSGVADARPWLDCAPEGPTFPDAAPIDLDAAAIDAGPPGGGDAGPADAGW